jgi:hypothetical protein
MEYTDCYVYAHRRLDTNEVFYIGKGSGRRASSKKSRPLRWQVIAEIAGYTIEYLAINRKQIQKYLKSKHITSWGYMFRYKEETK